MQLLISEEKKTGKFHSRENLSEVSRTTERSEGESSWALGAL